MTLILIFYRKMYTTKINGQNVRICIVFVLWEPFWKCSVQAIEPLKEVKIDCEQSLCSNIRGKENENIESVRYTSSGASLTLLVLLLIFLFVLTGFTYSKRETACELRSKSISCNSPLFLNLHLFSFEYPIFFVHNSILINSHRSWLSVTSEYFLNICG